MCYNIERDTQEKAGATMYDELNNLKNTTMWKLYEDKQPSQSRSLWVTDMYRTAINKLKTIHKTFPNYTLHDETHVINVLHAMSGILGSEAKNLTMEECEILILSAALHDVGMSYTEEDIEQVKEASWFEDFLHKRNSSYIGYHYDKLPKGLQQDYLRSIHHRRISDILRDASNGWPEKPDEVKFPMDVLSAVCQAHGEDKTFLRNDPDLEYREAYSADLRFCALLLRIGDILDFDGSRAPHILYPFAEDDPVSAREYKKHNSSKGFQYPEDPTAKELTFCAECTEPEVEHKLRQYLDWIDEELSVFAGTKDFLHKSWQGKLPLPYRVDRSAITRINYDSDEVRFTMDQSQILSLLTGENLYDSNDIFIRELLQNSIDATLLRGKLDRNFQVNSEEAAIYLWEWHDNTGNLFFRIDDNGTGMTRGMLLRYFLKVGKSYYNSPELKTDLERSGCKEGYCANSRFGIGFLSSFLCAKRAEISTLYCDNNKSSADCGKTDRHRGYGLRMELPGLEGHYVLRNQAAGHRPSGKLPCPDIIGTKTPPAERDFYRKSPGTSIVLHIDPGKLGAIDLRRTVEKWLLGPRMPIYYNGQRIGSTYDKILSEVRPMVGGKCFEISNEDKLEFDRCYPHLKGNYPEAKVTARILEDYKLPGLGGITLNYEVVFPNPRYKYLDQEYELKGEIFLSDNDLPYIQIRAHNIDDPYHFCKNIWADRCPNEEIKQKLFNEFEKLSQCPVESKGFEEAWKPFSRISTLRQAWQEFVDEKQPSIGFYLPKEITPTAITKHPPNDYLHCTYRSVMCEAESNLDAKLDYYYLFYCEEDLRPTMNVSRSRITHLPLPIALTMGTIQAGGSYPESYDELRNEPFRVWKDLIRSPYGTWAMEMLDAEFKNFISFYEMSISECNIRDLDLNLVHDRGALSQDSIIKRFYKAYIQENYHIRISYKDGQVLCLEEKRSEERETVYDLLPPLMFCKADDNGSRDYLCCKDSSQRRGITEDHRFAQWLLKNVKELHAHYPRQLEQIVRVLREEEDSEIIATSSFIRKLFRKWGVKKIDVESMPVLSEKDFWDPTEYLSKKTGID